MRSVLLKKITVQMGDKGIEQESDAFRWVTGIVSSFRLNYSELSTIMWFLCYFIVALKGSKLSYKLCETRLAHILYIHYCHVPPIYFIYNFNDTNFPEISSIIYEDIFWSSV